MTPARTALALATLVTASPAAADRFLFNSLNLTVNPISGTQFEVIEARGAGPRDIWCAAGKFAYGTLLAPAERLYIAAPRGTARTEPGRKGVIFTTQAPANAAPTGVSVTVRRAGASLPVHHARQFCRDRIIAPEDILP